MERGDDGPPLDTEPAQCGGELVEAGRQLEVDVEPDSRCLVREERKRVVERRQLRRHLAQLIERA